MCGLRIWICTGPVTGNLMYSLNIQNAFGKEGKANWIDHFSALY